MPQKITISQWFRNYEKKYPGIQPKKATKNYLFLKKAFTRTPLGLKIFLKTPRKMQNRFTKPMRLSPSLYLRRFPRYGPKTKGCQIRIQRGAKKPILAGWPYEADLREPF